MLIDLHIHTLFSGDAMAAPEDVVDRALALGLDGVCVVEHGSYEASATAAGGLKMLNRRSDGRSAADPFPSASPFRSKYSRHWGST